MRQIEQRAKEMGFEISSDPIQPGDWYLAERNSGPKLLICKYVKYTELGDPDWIVPEEFPAAYCFDVRECVKVIGLHVPDTTGSISDESLEAFLAEVKSMMEG